jgi:two-component system, response regulator YesN
MGRECILVVENDRTFLEVITLTLSYAYEVKQATTAAEALRIVRCEPVSIVVLEHRLPDGTGLELLSAIKSARPSLPAIMITGYGSESVCASAFKLGLCDYFSKPLDVFALLQSVRRAVSNGESDTEAVVDEGRAQGMQGPSSRQPDMAIQKVAVLIQQRYWSHLTLTYLASEVGMSKHRLSRRFNEVMGISLRSYLFGVRLERAKELLAAKQSSVTEVALAVGFGDLPHFDKFFKRCTGVSPSAYRASRLMTTRDKN